MVRIYPLHRVIAWLDCDYCALWHREDQRYLFHDVLKLVFLDLNDHDGMCLRLYFGLHEINTVLTFNWIYRRQKNLVPGLEEHLSLLLF